MNLTIHHLEVAQSERIVFLAEELGLDYDLVLHKRNPFLSPQSIKDLNVLGQAPVIQDGPITLAESAACADYILQKYGNGRLSLSPSHNDFADYLYWFHFANGNLQPQLSKCMLVKFADVDPSNSYAKRQHDQLDKLLSYMDTRLKQNSFLAGEEFTAADCMNFFSLTTMRAYHPVDLSPYPNVLRYLKTIAGRAGYKRAMAKCEPGMTPAVDAAPPEQFVDRQKAAGKM